MSTQDDSLSYHDLFITTPDLPRTSLFNLPYGVELRCNRVTGWELWDMWSAEPVLIAGEYHDVGMRLDVAGRVILDSLAGEPADS